MPKLKGSCRINSVMLYAHIANNECGRLFLTPRKPIYRTILESTHELKPNTDTDDPASSPKALSSTAQPHFYLVILGQLEPRA